MKTIDIKKVQERVANISIGPSTLRNQGPQGTIKAAREFIYTLDLKKLRSITEDDFVVWLNDRTDEMSNRFPGEARGNWGAARKAMNVFLENAFYDRLLSEKYNLQNLYKILEIPLDSKVVRELRKDSHDPTISCTWDKWDMLDKKQFTIIGLKSGDSAIYQECAAEVAKQKYHKSRIFLDLYYWGAKD